MRIIVDSCVDINPKILSEQDIVRVPFKVTINGVEYTDNGTTVIDELRAKDYKSKNINTACPAPGEYYEAMKGADEIFIVTISSALSGSHQSAVSAKKFYEEETPGSKIHVFDSKSASAGETLVVLELIERVEQGMPFEEIVVSMQAFIDSMDTYFSLETLDTLVSAGRVGRTEQLASKALRLFPIMGDDGTGNIESKAIVRGAKHVFPKIVELITPKENVGKTLAITHVDAKTRAEDLKALLEQTFRFKDIFVFEASGLSSVYASKGGIVMAY